MWLFYAVYHLLSCINNRMGQVGLVWWCAWEIVHSTAWYSLESVWTNDSTVWLVDLEPKQYVMSGMRSTQNYTLSFLPPTTHTHTHTHTRRLYHGLDCYLLACDCRGLILIPGQCTWDLWSMKWHWNPFFLKVIQFSTVTIIPPIHTHISFICQW